MKRDLLNITLTLLALHGLSLGANDGYILHNNQRSLEEINKIYSQMPPVQYVPPTDRWSNLPLTAKRLKQGGTLRVVMLGDSIVNDTSRSCWHLLLENIGYGDKQE